MITPTCSECHGTNIRKDAYAEWDNDKQEWVLFNTFDKPNWCENCEGECSIDWKEIS